MSVTDGLVIAVLLLYFGLLYVWSRQRGLDRERALDSVRIAVLEGRTNLLTKAARELRDRDAEKTQEMTAHELARLKRGQGPPRGH